MKQKQNKKQKQMQEEKKFQHVCRTGSLKLNPRRKQNLFPKDFSQA